MSSTTSSAMSDSQTSNSIISSGGPVKPTMDDNITPDFSNFTFNSGAKNQISPTRARFDPDAPTLADSKGIMRPIDYGAPGEKKPEALRKMSTVNSRRRSQFYDDRFKYKEDQSSMAKDRVAKDSPVIADLRTNVIVKDEYTLVTDISRTLSQRYARSESAILVTITHSACLMLGGSFEPAYIMTISALEKNIQPTLNKRNAAMVQACLADVMEVPIDRGIIKFQAIPEENLATGGKTMSGEMENLQRELGDEGIGLAKAVTKGSKMSFSMPRKASVAVGRKASISGKGYPPPPPPAIPHSTIPIGEAEERLNGNDDARPCTAITTTSTQPAQKSLLFRSKSLLKWQTQPQQSTQQQPQHQQQQQPQPHSQQQQQESPVLPNSPILPTSPTSTTSLQPEHNTQHKHQRSKSSSPPTFQQLNVPPPPAHDNNPSSPFRKLSKTKSLMALFRPVR